MRISVDRRKCLGAGNCLLHAPIVFDQSEDDYLVILLDEHPGEEHRSAVLLAADLGPGQAISVEG